MNKPELSIIIPAHNEEENLPILLQDLIQLVENQKWRAEIIVVNDHSSDRTKEILDYWSGMHKVIRAIHRNTGERGMGITLIEGTKQAKGEIILWTMADRSDNLQTYPELVNKIKQGFDIVFASRYMSGGNSGDLDYFKTICSGGYTKVAKLFLGIPVDDITNAFRAFKKSIFDSLNIVSADFSISPEMAIKAYKAGYKLGQVPTTYKNRKAGRSKFKMLKMGLRYGRFLLGFY